MYTVIMLMLVSTLLLKNVFASWGHVPYSNGFLPSKQMHTAVIMLMLMSTLLLKNVLASWGHVPFSNA